MERIPPNPDPLTVSQPGLDLVWQWLDWDLVPYREAWTWQREYLAARKAAIAQGQTDLADVLLTVEHPPTYTLGRGSNRDFVKFEPTAPGWDLIEIERGGEVTYHGPGQWVGYPLLNLRQYQTDLHWYLRQLEEVLIVAIGHWGLEAERIPGLTGVWVAGHKVAAIGVYVSRWFTMHGWALNVCPDLAGFRSIVPCGIGDRPVGSLAQFVPGLTIAAVKPVVIAAIETVFGVRIKGPFPHPRS